MYSKTFSNMRVDIDLVDLYDFGAGGEDDDFVVFVEVYGVFEHVDWEQFLWIL